MNSYDEVNHLEKESVVISLAMPNLLQDNVHKQEDDMEDHEELTTSCVNSEPSHYNAPVTPTENNDIGNTHGATLTEGESSLNVLKFSTNHAMIEKILVEPSLDLPLSQDDLLDIPCDKDDLHDHEHKSTEPPTCAELKHVNHIDSGMNELKLLSSLKILGYIEFDVLCNLSDLEEQFLNMLSCHGALDIHIMLLENMTTMENI